MTNAQNSNATRAQHARHDAQLSGGADFQKFRRRDSLNLIWRCLKIITLPPVLA